MKTSIFYCIPNQEEKFKEYFANGATWHNNLWHSTNKYVEILKHWQGLIKDQQANYKKISEDLKLEIKIAREKLEKQITTKELKQKLAIAYKKRAGEIPLESWETREGLEAYIKELEEQLSHLEEKKRYQSWLLNDFTFLNYQAYLKKFPQAEPWQENLTEWESSYQQLNKHDIWLVEQTSKRIVFDYQIPDNIQPNLKKYLFNYLGVWYEYNDSKLTGYTRATVFADYSVYWNDYWYFLKANANGIIHNSPFLQEEVCMCPSFTQEEHKVTNIFVITNYELKFHCWRFIGREDGFFTYNKKVFMSADDNFPWFKVGEWQKFVFAQPTVDEQGLEWGGFDWKKIVETKKGELFSLVSQSYSGGALPGKHDIKLEGHTGKDGKLVTISAGGEEQLLNEVSLTEWLKTNYPPELNHCRANHIGATLYWRDMVIWQGNYWDIRDLWVNETSNPSGTHLVFYGNSRIIATVYESIFIKIGASDKLNPILQVLVSTAVGTLTGLVTGGIGGAAGAALGKAAAVGALKGVTAGVIKAGTQQAWHVEHFRTEYTIDEFQHKWTNSGINPIGLTLEQDKELINRYLANRTLKKSNEGNEYFNATTFGNYLTREGFNKFHFLSLNMYGNYQNWFKEKLQEGVWISDKIPQKWYELKLPKTKIVSSSAISSGDLEEMIITNKVGATSGWDDKSNIGGGLWVYKKSRIAVCERKEDMNSSPDLLPWLMDEIQRRREWYNPSYISNTDHWTLLHPHPTFEDERVDIPSQYLTKEHEGMKVCPLHYDLYYYSDTRHGSSGVKDELRATHFLVSRRSSGSRGEVDIQIIGYHRVTRKMPGKPAPGFGNPPPDLPPGEIVPELPDIVPDQPDINIPEPGPDAPEPTPGEPDMPTDPDVPTPDQDSGQDPDPFEPDPNDPDATPDTEEPDLPDPDDIPDSDDAD